MTRRSLEQKTECPGVRGQDVGVRGVSTEGSLNSASGTDGPITGISVFRCGRIRAALLQEFPSHLEDGHMGPIADSSDPPARQDHSRHSNRRP